VNAEASNSRGKRETTSLRSNRTFGSLAVFAVSRVRRVITISSLQNGASPRITHPRDRLCDRNSVISPGNPSTNRSQNDPVPFDSSALFHLPLNFDPKTFAILPLSDAILCLQNNHIAANFIFQLRAYPAPLLCLHQNRRPVTAARSSLNESSLYVLAPISRLQNCQRSAAPPDQARRRFIQPENRARRVPWLIPVAAAFHRKVQPYPGTITNQRVQEFF